MFRHSPFPQPSRSSTQTTLHRNDIKDKSLERDNKSKGPEFLKVSSTTKCYKCQGYEHLATNCPSLIRITIINETPTEATESDSEEYIYDPGDVETDEESTSDDVGLSCINQTPSTPCLLLNVPLHKLAEKDD